MVETGIAPRQLRYVVALAEHHSVRRAAARVAVPPRALLREITGVERRLGTRLFERLPRKAVPTAAGKEIAHVAGRELASRVAENLDAAAEGVVLHVGCVNYGPGEAIQRAAISEFQAQYPGVPVQLVPLTFRQQPGAIAEGELDAGFCSGPKPVLPGIRSEVLLRETIGCALLPLGHRLAGMEALSLSDLSGFPLHTIRMEDSPQIMASVQDSVSRSGWRGRHLFRTSMPSEVMAMVACGAGWSPGPTALRGWSPAGVVSLPLADGPLAIFDIHAAWRGDDRFATAFARLVLELRDVIEAAHTPPDGGVHEGGYRALLAQRQAERARIARELHEAMLRGVADSELQLDALRRQLPPSLREENAQLERVIERLERAALDGSGVLRDPRPGLSGPRDLALALRSAAEEMRERSTAELRMRTSGVTRELRSSVEEAAYRVGTEAIANAFRHASASLVSVSLEYLDDLFRMRVSDDGAGIDPGILRAGGRPGHLGLSLMKERAAAVGGRLAFRSGPGEGTVVEMVVPGQSAFVHLAANAPSDRPAGGAGADPRGKPGPGG